MDRKEVYTHTHTHTHTHTLEIYSSIKNEIKMFVATWIDLEIIILSEISQKEKDTTRYHLFVESKINTRERIWQREIDS